MRRWIRYGDDETIVTRSQQVFAILFVIGIASLLVGAAWTAYGDAFSDETRTKVAFQDPGSTA